MKTQIERRSHPRLPLQSVVMVSRGPGHDAIEVLTKDISAGGFYYQSGVKPVLGQTLDCVIVIAPEHMGGGLHLQCSAEVLRVEPPSYPGGLHGVACRIEEYQVRTETFDGWK